MKYKFYIFIFLSLFLITIGSCSGGSSGGDSGSSDTGGDAGGGAADGGDAGGGAADGGDAGGGDAGGGDADPSEEAPAGVVPESIDVLTVTPSGGKVLVEWDAPSDFAKTSEDFANTGYNIYYQVDDLATTDSPMVTTNPGDTNKTVTGLNNGKVYCFAVTQAKDVIPEGELGGQLCAMPANKLVLAPVSPACGGTIVDNSAQDTNLAVGIVGIPLRWTVPGFSTNNFWLGVDYTSLDYSHVDDTWNLSVNEKTVDVPAGGIIAVSNVFRVTVPFLLVEAEFVVPPDALMSNDCQVWVRQ